MPVIHSIGIFRLTKTAMVLRLAFLWTSMLESSAVFKLCKYKLHPVRSDLKIFPEKRRRKLLIQITANFTQCFSFGSSIWQKCTFCDFQRADRKKPNRVQFSVQYAFPICHCWLQSFIEYLNKKFLQNWISTNFSSIIGNSPK